MNGFFLETSVGCLAVLGFLWPREDCKGRLEVVRVLMLISFPPDAVDFRRTHYYLGLLDIDLLQSLPTLPS